MAPVDESIRERIEAHSDSLRQSGFAVAGAALDSTVQDILGQHGQASMAAVQALTDAGVLLARLDAPSDAVPYFRRALEAAQKVYGRDHRETAFALHDYAQIQVLALDPGFATDATALHAEALAVRRRVLGERHPETAASEISVAKQLVRACDAQPPCAPADERLAQALRLATHALEVFRAEGRNEPRDAHSASELVAQINVKRGARLMQGR